MSAIGHLAVKLDMELLCLHAQGYHNQREHAVRKAPPPHRPRLRGADRDAYNALSDSQKIAYFLATSKGQSHAQAMNTARGLT